MLPIPQRSRRLSRTFGCLRLLLAILLAMSISGLSHAAEEGVEMVLHSPDTGPHVHADHCGDDGVAVTPEDFCFGGAHHCGCCPTAFAAPLPSTSLPCPASDRLREDILNEDAPLDGMRARIDRPPRA